MTISQVSGHLRTTCSCYKGQVRDSHQLPCNPVPSTGPAPCWFSYSKLQMLRGLWLPPNPFEEMLSRHQLPSTRCEMKHMFSVLLFPLGLPKHAGDIIIIYYLPSADSIPSIRPGSLGPANMACSQPARHSSLVTRIHAQLLKLAAGDPGF